MRAPRPSGGTWSCCQRSAADNTPNDASPQPHTSRVVVGLLWHQWHCRDLAIVTSPSPPLVSSQPPLPPRRRRRIVAVVPSPCRRTAVPPYRRRIATVPSPWYRRRVSPSVIAAVSSPPPLSALPAVIALVARQNLGCSQDQYSIGWTDQSCANADRSDAL